jgi:archaellum component FlaC
MNDIFQKGEKKMTRKDLEKIYYLKRELKMWEKRYEELCADMSQDTPSADGMPHSVTNKISSPTEDKAILLADHVALIAKHMAKIREAIREVESFISGIEDPLIRQIVELRCVKCMSWEEVADLIGRSSTAENTRLIYHRFIKSKFETNVTQ